jgi:hypothetical protein
MLNVTQKENSTAKAVILAGLKKILTTKEPSLTDFIKQNNLRCLRSKRFRFATRVSVITSSGREIYGYGNTFTDAFSELKRKFGSV